MYPDYHDDKTAKGPEQQPLYTYVPASTPPTSEYSKWVKPEHGGCLTLWVVVSAIMSVIALFGFINLFGIVSRIPPAYRNISLGTMCLLGGLIVAQLGCLWGIWNWKKWGVYGMGAMAIASPFIESALGIVSASDWIAPLIQIGILYFLVNQKWDYYD